MATDRPRQPQKEYTLDEALALIGKVIADKQLDGKQATIPFDVSLNQRGRIAAIHVYPHRPRKVRIA